MISRVAIDIRTASAVNQNELTKIILWLLKLRAPKSQIIPDIEVPPIAGSVRKKFGVRSAETLPLLRLIRIPFTIAHNLARYTLGFGRQSDEQKEKRLEFFILWQ